MDVFYWTDKEQGCYKLIQPEKNICNIWMEKKKKTEQV